VCEKRGILPKAFACMRSSALPLSHTTTRTEAVTLLRLARLLNFMKSLIDNGIPLPESSAADVRIDNPADRIAAGRQLLQKFLNDGRIKGVTPEGTVFDHVVSAKLTRQFLEGLRSATLRGSR
jgi:hypothetical protein